MLSHSFITQPAINKQLNTMQDGEKSLLFYFSSEDSPKLSLCISFIELYSLKFVLMTCQGFVKNLSINKQAGCSAKNIIFLKSEF